MITNHEILWDEEHVARIWNYYSQNRSYDHQYFAHHSGRYIIDYVVRFLDLNGKTILDFGCGTGFLLDQLMTRTNGKSKYIAADTSRQSIDLINKKFRSNPEFTTGYLINNLPIEMHDKSADIIFCVELVEHLPENQLNTIFKELLRILTPRGNIVVTTPNRENLEENKTICPECGCIFHRWQHLISWTTETLKNRMEKVG